MRVYTTKVILVNRTKSTDSCLSCTSTNAKRIGALTFPISLSLGSICVLKAFWFRVMFLTALSALLRPPSLPYLIWLLPLSVPLTCIVTALPHYLKPLPTPTLIMKYGSRVTTKRSKASRVSGLSGKSLWANIAI
jgi:hypothetical protein